MRYFCPAHLMDNEIKIAVVGVGGTGGEVVDALTRLDAGIKALGHENGLSVTVFDDDVVEPHNVGRQRYSLSDVGLHKAITIINRANMFCGLNWYAEPRHFNPNIKDWGGFDIVIGCTDKARFRVDLGASSIKSASNTPEPRVNPVLWLDFGNGQTTGQAVLGHLRQGSDAYYLPHVYDLYPNLADPEMDREAAPRCSLAEALQGPDGQDLFVNAALVKMGMNILWQLLTKGVIESHGVQVDVRNMTSSPMKIDPEAWSFMGYETDVIDFA